MLQFQEIIYLQQVDTNGIPSSKCKHCSLAAMVVNQEAYKLMVKG